VPLEPGQVVQGLSVLELQEEGLLMGYPGGAPAARGGRGRGARGGRAPVGLLPFHHLSDFQGQPPRLLPPPGTPRCSRPLASPQHPSCTLVLISGENVLIPSRSVLCSAR